MQCNSCTKQISEFETFKSLGGDKFECEGCSDKTSCMYCKRTIRRGESYQRGSNDRYICEKCGNGPRCAECEGVIVSGMGIDKNDDTYHKKCAQKLFADPIPNK